MTTSMHKGTSGERLGNSLKIATFLAVAGLVTLAASSHLSLSSPESIGFGDGAYTSTVAEAPANPGDTTAGTGKPADYFPAQFEIKGQAADPSMPTF